MPACRISALASLALVASVPLLAAQEHQHRGAAPENLGHVVLSPVTLRHSSDLGARLPSCIPSGGQKPAKLSMP